MAEPQNTEDLTRELNRLKEMETQMAEEVKGLQEEEGLQQLPIPSPEVETQTPVTYSVDVNVNYGPWRTPIQPAPSSRQVRQGPFYGIQSVRGSSPHLAPDSTTTSDRSAIHAVRRSYAREVPSSQKHITTRNRPAEVSGMPSSQNTASHLTSLSVRRSNRASSISSPDELTSHRLSSLTRQPRSLSANESEQMLTRKLEQEKKIVGEICYQLNQRILKHIFSSDFDLSKDKLKDVFKNIKQVATDPVTGLVEDTQIASMEQRYTDMMNKLKTFGYNDKFHPEFSEEIINSYGTLTNQTPPGTSQHEAYDLSSIFCVVLISLPVTVAQDVLCLLECLHHLSVIDGKPIFFW
ncbi:speriolin-like [Protopterus annectens]|uniref:speriolin-like n=1 Tax=Protopterus annectens TaxID=7888 RepID=UPI001CFB8E05|nr:speriolin-like [Protopterus annectens]